VTDYAGMMKIKFWKDVTTEGEVVAITRSLFYTEIVSFSGKLDILTHQGDLKCGNLHFPYVGLLNILKINISLFCHAVLIFRMFRSPTAHIRKMETSLFQFP
jgi:hypothetical protein